ncbi:hypothetical protein C8R42DRAFT_197301 [Lentinula raphanica]|nr:hypothetical protein C8R42DRAFT_197301 [Lentinula raphanica]
MNIFFSLAGLWFVICKTSLKLLQSPPPRLFIILPPYFPGEGTKKNIEFAFDPILQPLVAFPVTSFVQYQNLSCNIQRLRTIHLGLLQPIGQGKHFLYTSFHKQEFWKTIRSFKLYRREQPRARSRPDPVHRGGLE